MTDTRNLTIVQLNDSHSVETMKKYLTAHHFMRSELRGTFIPV